MSILRTQAPAATYADTNNVVSLAFGGNVTNGHLVVVCVSGYSTSATVPTTSEISTSGTATLGAWTADKGNYVADGACSMRGAIFSAPVTGTGSLTITFTCTGGSYVGIAIAEYSGTDVSSSRVNTTGTGTGSTTSNVQTATFTTSGATLIIGGLANDPNGTADTITKGSNYTLVSAPAHSTGVEVGMEEWMTSGSQTNTVANWTITTTSAWVGNAVSYKAASSSANWLKEGYWWDNPYSGRNQYWRPKGSSIFRPKRHNHFVLDLGRKAA